MRIFHPITRLVRGGAQLNTLMCAAEQALRGHDVVVASGLETGPEGSYLEEARNGPYRFIEVPSLTREVHPWNDLRAFLHLYRIIREHRFDIVHTHTSKAGILGRWAAWLAGCRAIVHTPHGNVFYGYFSRPKEAVFRLVERASARITARLVMLSEGDRRDHIQAGICDGRRLTIIPSGVPIEAFSGPRTPEDEHSARILGLPLGRVLVGTVARLVPVKGVLDLLEAFARVAREVPESFLVVVGDGPERSSVERRVQDLGLERDVLLAGRLDQVRAVLKHLELFVLASHNEGMGRAAVEALAAGVPVVATRVGGLPDVVTPEVGRLVPPGDPERLGLAILEVLRDQEGRKKMGLAAAHRAAAFSADVMFSSLNLVYREALRSATME